MLTYIKLALAIYNVAKWIVSRLERQKWFREGQAEMARQQREDMDNEVDKARAADAAVTDDSRAVHDDPNNRNRNSGS